MQVAIKTPISKVLVLVFKRSPDPKILLLRVLADRGGTWQPVTGGVEQGETLEKAARREATEETGLTFVPQLLSLGIEHEFQGRWGLATESAFAWEISDQADPSHVRIDSSEHTAFEWVSIQEAIERVPFDFQRRAVEVLSKLF
jgi:8-oxo-dGTP pyrophosphatase MutT (NUDIX family)